MDEHATDRPSLTHAAHWGSFSARWDGEPTGIHGDPNVLTRDLGTSRLEHCFIAFSLREPVPTSLENALAQGSCGQVTTIQCERFDGVAPPVRAHEPPASALAG